MKTTFIKIIGVVLLSISINHSVFACVKSFNFFNSFGDSMKLLSKIEPFVEEDEFYLQKGINGSKVLPDSCKTKDPAMDKNYIITPKNISDE